ncbi:MAG: CapA family protein [Bauldia sp.]
MASRRVIRLALCGDVMTGRGIDQILPHPSPPTLHEPYVKSARDYVALAEDANGPIERPVSFDYIWGDALAELDRRQPDLRIVNLETAVTRSDRPAAKGINYRMNPDNVPCLLAAGIDCCILANNHVLDWGREGLVETLDVLRLAGLKSTGAGQDAETAANPAALPVAGKRRVLVYAFACPSSGAPPDWAATASRPGVNLLNEASQAAAAAIVARIARDRRPDDLVVVSIHWGPNWGYDVPPAERAFAHRLIEADVDVLHGHSSHHPKAVELHRGKPILYGCGDFINDYEGIGKDTGYRDDLPLIYVLDFDAADRRLVGLEMVPFVIRRFRLSRADPADTAWLQAELDRECRRFGARVHRAADGTLHLLATERGVAKAGP